MIKDDDDARVRMVADGLVKLVGNDVAGQQLARLYSADQTRRALMPEAWRPTLDLTVDGRPAVDLQHQPGETRVRRRYSTRPAVTFESQRG